MKRISLFILSVIFIMTASTVAFSDVNIDSANFPDEAFRNYVKRSYDTNGDEILSTEEIAGATWLPISGVSDLKGIEYLTALIDMSCYNSSLTKLDVSKNTALIYLKLSGNDQLKELDVSGCTALKELDCSHAQLTKLDVSKNTALERLYCYNNKLIKLNLGKNVALTTLDCSENQLTTLNVSGCTALMTLSCCDNQLKTLNVSSCAALTELYCTKNQLTEIIFSNGPMRTHVECDNNVTFVREGINPKISTQTITNAIRGKSYTFKLSGNGGTAPYTWSISKGSLPNGLKLNASTGKITGKPTKAGTFTFTVQFKDDSDKTATKEFTMKVTQTTITASIPATIVRGKSYTWTPKASGGTSAYTWSKSAGTLPNGMSINASTGKITGKPTKAGTFKFTIKAIDKNKVAATKAFTVKVTQTTITLTVPTTIIRGKSYSWTPKASGGTSAYTWSKSAGTLPNGMSINASTGKITGKPSKAGTFKFTIKVTDKNKIAATKAFTVKVTQTTVSAAIPATIVRGKSYTWTPKASGGTSAYTWTISKGSLPTGMKINASTGKITGKPTTTGTFSFTVRAKDKNGIAGTKAFTVKVTEATASTKSQAVNSKTTADFETGTSTAQSLKASIPVTLQTGTLTAQGNGTITLAATLNVASDDVVESYDGKDSDLVKVKADTELTFIIGEWGVDVSELTVYVDDKPVEGLTVEDSKFTLPAEMVHDDFKVSVKAQSEGVEHESEELYIISE